MSDGGVCGAVRGAACGVWRAACEQWPRPSGERGPRAGGKRRAKGATLLLYHSTPLLLYCSTTLLLYCSRAAHLDAPVACDGDGAEHLTRRVLPRLERAVHALCGVDAARLVKGGLGVGLELG